MDIESLVSRITKEVLKEVGQLAAASDRMPPAGGSSGEATKTRDGKTCLLRTTGECAGVGCCAELVPGHVRKIVNEGADRVGNRLGGVVSASDIAARIDHTLLKAEATSDEVRELCREAREHQFASVCVNPGFVALAADLLRGSAVKVCTVVGFPLGATTTFTKVAETKEAVSNGADEIDMVINIGALKNGEDHLVEDDMREVVRAASGRLTKSIFETALLSDDEVIRACRMAKRAGLDFVKTSTGFGPGGATVHHVALMRKTVGRSMGVKASGGVRDLEGAQAMIEAGATRIGASASVKIVRGEQGADSY
jgi:deoxyribose-phosphate aldolase